MSTQGCRWGPLGHGERHSVEGQEASTEEMLLRTQHCQGWSLATGERAFVSETCPITPRSTS